MIEIQIHPSDIRRRVRYFFFDRRRVVIGIVALSVLLATVEAKSWTQARPRECWMTHYPASSSA